MSAVLTEADAFLADIVATPADDVPRLIYADWLDEHGEPERAEFIRLQCRLARLEKAAERLRRGEGISQGRGELQEHALAALRRREQKLLDAICCFHNPDWWADLRKHLPDVDLTTNAKRPGRCVALMRRGFVACARLPLAAWYGGQCGQCYGGAVSNLDGGRDECEHCHGSGRTPGHGPALVRAHPLERVELSDMEPLPWQKGRVWVRDDHRQEGRVPEALPWAIYDQLPEPRGREAYYPFSRFAIYKDDVKAQDAVSAACLAWARQPLPGD